MVHRTKVDELAGYIMTTASQGGLLVTDLNKDRILWALPTVCKKNSSLPFLGYPPLTIVVCPSIRSP